MIEAREVTANSANTGLIYLGDALKSATMMTWIGLSLSLALLFFEEGDAGAPCSEEWIKKRILTPALGWLNSFRLLEPIGYITAREAEKAFYANICTCNLIACAALASLR